MDPWYSWRLVRPEAWWLVLLAPAVWLVWWYARRQRRHALKQWLGDQAGLFLPPARWVGRALILLILFGFITALAGPEAGTRPMTPQATARDLVVLIDVSQSMLAEDRPPSSRLTRAKDALLHLLDHWQRRGSTTRLSVGIFAGRARLLCPPTEDREHLAKVVAELSPDSFGSLGRLTDQDTAGTSFRPAVRLAEEWFAAAAAEAAYTDFLLISDGDDVAGDVQTAATAAREARLTLNVLGIGDPAHDWPVPQGTGFLMTTDPGGGPARRVLTRRRDDSLRTLVDTTSGRLILEETDPRPLVSWWEDDLAVRPGRPLHSTARLIPVDRSDWILAGVLILMMLELACGGARRREW